MDRIQYGNKTINFMIKEGNRKKTVAIHVDDSSTVTVLIPPGLEEERIRMVLEKRVPWILEKQERIKKDRHFYGVKDFVSGESFPYMGRQYRLKVVKSAAAKGETCKLTNGRLQVEVARDLCGEESKTAVKNTLMDWYVAHAEVKIKQRFPRFAHQIGVWPKSIEIKDQKKRWGSCSQSGILRFNWKVVMAPVSVLDYVIVHELCHLIYANHSSQFWQKVQTVIPDYKKKRGWLKKNNLMIVNNI